MVEDPSSDEASEPSADCDNCLAKDDIARLLDLTDVDAELAALEQEARSYPDDRLTLFKLGIAYFCAGKVQEARSMWKLTYHHGFKCPFLYHLLAVVHPDSRQDVSEVYTSCPGLEEWRRHRFASETASSSHLPVMEEDEELELDEEESPDSAGTSNGKSRSVLAFQEPSPPFLSPGEPGFDDEEVFLDQEKPIAPLPESRKTPAEGSTPRKARLPRPKVSNTLTEEERMRRFSAALAEARRQRKVEASEPANGSSKGARPSPCLSPPRGRSLSFRSAGSP